MDSFNFNMLKYIKLYGKKHCRLPDASPQKIQRIYPVVSLAITDFQPCCASRLNRQDLERMRESFRAKRTTNGTINKYQAYICAILAWGVDQDLIRINPWRDYRLLKHNRPIIRANVDDLRRLYPYLPESLQWMVKTAFFLALRPGQVELLSLTWDAFNWRRGIVIIRPGKSEKLKTVIPHPDYFAEAHQRFRVTRQKVFSLFATAITVSVSYLLEQHGKMHANAPWYPCAPMTSGISLQLRCSHAGQTLLPLQHSLGIAMSQPQAVHTPTSLRRDSFWPHP